jgi:molecular chaperone DnaK
MAKKALIIANSRYDDERFAPLPGAAADAETLARVLSDPDIEEFTVETVMDTGLRATMRAIQLFFSSAKAGDLLLLHLSLHGWKDIRGRLYFIACDTERDLPEATAMSAHFVSDLMRQSKSERIVLLLDCCYSGAFTAGMTRRSSGSPRVNVSEPFAGSGRVVITSSTSLQFAHESDPGVLSSQEEAQPSPFTAAVAGGLRDGAADLDGDGRISVSELYEYVHEQVLQKVPGQTPTFSVDNARGTIYLTRSPHSPDTGIPAEPDAADDLMLDRISSTEMELEKLAARRELLEERIKVFETQIGVSGQLIDQLLETGYKDGLRREVRETHERRAHAQEELSALIAYMSSIERRTEFLEE